MSGTEIDEFKREMKKVEGEMKKVEVAKVKLEKLIAGTTDRELLLKREDRLNKLEDRLNGLHVSWQRALALQFQTTMDTLSKVFKFIIS